MIRSASPVCALMTVCVFVPPTGRLVPYMCPAPLSSVCLPVPCRTGRFMPSFGYETDAMTPSRGSASCVL